MPIRVVSMFGNCAEPIPFGVRLGLLAVRACVRAWMTSIISVIKGMQQKTECFRAKSARAGLGLRGVGMNQV